MSHGPADSAIRITPEIAKAFETANAEQIKQIMASAAVEQGLATRDYYSPDVLIPTELAGAAPKRVAKTVTVDGVKYIIEGATETELAQKETALYQKLFVQPAITEQTQEESRSDGGQFVSAEATAAKAALELAFKRGDISASEYLQRSGAVAEYLANAGVPLEYLKASVAEKQNQKFQQSYQDATQTFIARHPEWQGGDRNRETLGRIILEQDLTNGDPLKALEQAYEHARKNNMLVENPEVAYHREMEAVRSHEDIARLNHKYFGTGLFNR